jgi:hypothetical protein
MTEEKDIYFGAPKEHVEFAKKVVPKMGGMMALMAKAVYEKYGLEAIEVIAEEVKKAGREKGKKFREEAGYKPEEVTVDIALNEIYPKSHGALAAAGLDLRRKKLTKTESESHVHYCGLCEGWKETWPEGTRYLCHIYSAEYDIGFMEGVNPKLKWSAHSDKYIDREEERGLSKVPPGGSKPGADSESPCIMKVILMD